jgi:hypothetical protein
MQDKVDSTSGKSSRPRQSPLAGNPGDASEPPRTGPNTSSPNTSSPNTGSPNFAGSGGDKISQATETIANTAQQAADKVASRLDTHKDKTADGLRNVSQALRQASDQLRSENQDAAMYGYVASAANQVDRLSDYLRSTSTREMVNGAEQFARQQPALFIGSAFMLGLLGARFLKSSSPSSKPKSVSRSGNVSAEATQFREPKYSTEFGQGAPRNNTSGKQPA